MKGQIQQHEWVKDAVLDGKYNCIHCRAYAYLLWSKLLYSKGGPITSEEPACITRQLNAPTNRDK